MYFEDFINQYAITKTLSFKLIPIGNTQANVDRNGIVDTDRKINEDYYAAKKILDRFYKDVISRFTSEAEMDTLGLDWNKLFLAFEKKESDKKDKAARDEFFTLCRKYRSGIASLFTNANIGSVSEIIKTAVSEGIVGDFPFNDEERKALEPFRDFTTYLSKYKTTRENILSDKQTVSVASRIIDDNFTFYAKNIQRFQGLPDSVKEELNTQLSSLSDKEINCFDPTKYSSFTNQAGIDLYNKFIGGVAENERNKTKGLNELLNEAYQQKRIPRKIAFAPLYKQIMTERQTFSFIAEPYKNDEDVLAAIKAYSEALNMHVHYKAEEIENVLESQSDLGGIYIQEKKVKELASILFSNWRLFNDIKLKKGSVTALQELQSKSDESILSNFSGKLTSLLNTLNEKEKELEPCFKLSKITDYTPIKNYLDAVLETEKLLGTLRTITVDADGNDKELAPEKDYSFYLPYDSFYELFGGVVPIYNRIRNYATKKPYSTEKFKLNFGNSTLVAGWDENKEKDNSCTLLSKDGKYYLGIYRKGCSLLRRMDKAKEDEPCYKKMIYKLLPSPNKMLPKIFVKSAKWLKDHPVSEEFLAKYDAGIHKSNNPGFDESFMHELIDYYKKSINEYGYDIYGFEFKETSEYHDINDYFADIEKSNHFTKWSFVPETEVNEMIDRGDLYLFQLYNKDFAEKSHGKKNLYTMYFENVFSDENMKHPNFKLNGEAELFYRPASIVNPFVHKEGSILFSKRYPDGTSLDNKLIAELAAKVKEGRSIDSLRNEYPSVTFRIAKHDIIKDRRFTKDSYEFHVPVTINKNSSGTGTNIDEEMRKKLISDDQINIIGIDRGERNLMYVSVINQNGEILEQRSLNCINGVDYNSKLISIEKERDAARKEWKTINNIKEMKAGYLSLAVNEITNMMLKYNAILVMEDLNYGFKRSRLAIAENSVYQKFENQLVSKLNYLCSKDDNARTGYQLTNKLSRIGDINKAMQTGAIFYVPAAFTSKIDPITGFVNLFRSEFLNYSSVKAAKDFIGRFESIRYDKEMNCFAFAFNYKDFEVNADYTDRWTVCTVGDDRIAHTIKDGRHEYTTVNVTEELEQLFASNGISLDSDIQKQIMNIDSVEFFKKLLWMFKVTVQLRYENAAEDYILSPIIKDGKWFDSREVRPEDKLPIDGDANGAYHIALQGLRMIRNIDKETVRIVPDKEGFMRQNYLKFCQKQEWKNQ